MLRDVFFMGPSVSSTLQAMEEDDIRETGPNSSTYNLEFNSCSEGKVVSTI